ncbi:MAG: PAS domain-containing protein [Verrucomicrobia bacterium]|nr:PAS domain-containing protein [Verrucomicrobiota bacterium]
MIERLSISKTSDIRRPGIAAAFNVEGEKRILVLAPTANDAALTVGFLRQASLHAEVCCDMYDLCHRVNQGCGAVLLAEEAIGSASVAVLVQTLGNQPSWSDIPVAIITSGGEASQTHLRQLSVFGPSGNVTLIERPFRPSTLISTLEVVLRFRQRQYMVRDLLQESRESKQHLEFVLKAGGLGTWQMDLRTKVVVWSDTCKANFGLQPKDEITFDVLMKMIHPEDRDRMVRSMNRSIKSGTDYHAEYRITIPNGEIRWINSNGRVAYSEAGAPLHLAGVTHNITERKRAELALLESESRFRELADAMPQVVWSARADGRVDYYNKRWFELTGLNQSSAPEGWIPLLHPEDNPKCIKAWKHSVSTDEPFEFECRFPDRERGDYRWYMIRALPIKDEQGEVVRWFGTCTDMDEQKRWAEKLEHTVVERTAALQQTIHSLETFNYSIAHDLRAPLRAMSGFSEAVLQDYKSKLDDEGVEYLERIRRSAVRMDRLVSDILDYGRLAQQEIPLETVNVEEVLSKVLADLHSEMQKSEATIQVQEPLPPVVANASVLNQVLLNLVSNAFKFVADGTTPTVRIRSERIGDRVRLWFEDNGIGIALEHQEKIFEIFQQLHRSEYSGTGIGLALVKKGVERMSGTIGVESKAGHGSSFWIELPGAVS